MILFFDVSATGKVKNWKGHETDVDNWPRMVHLAWQLYTDDRKLASYGNKIIKSTDFSIPKSESKNTGITQQQTEEEGIDIVEALNAFNEDVAKAKTVISFNWK